MKKCLVVFLAVGSMSVASMSCDSVTEDQSSYTCACDCHTPIGNVLNRFSVCATSEADAMSQTDEMMRKRGCGYWWTCYSCDHSGACQ